MNDEHDHDLNGKDAVLVGEIHADSGVMVMYQNERSEAYHVVTLHLDGASMIGSDDGIVQVQTEKLLLIRASDAEALLGGIHEALIACRVREKLMQMGVNVDGLDL